MLVTEALRDWFTSKVPDIPGSLDDLPEGTPHRAFAVRISGGLGLEVEDLLDRPTFTLYVRGVNGGDAEEWANTLDRAWIGADPMFYIGDYRVLGKGRFGGPPSYIGEDASEIYPGRVIRSATYWVRIVR